MRSEPLYVRIATDTVCYVNGDIWFHVNSISKWDNAGHMETSYFMNIAGIIIYFPIKNSGSNSRIHVSSILSSRCVT